MQYDIDHFEELICKHKLYVNHKQNYCKILVIIIDYSNLIFSACTLLDRYTSKTNYRTEIQTITVLLL